MTEPQHCPGCRGYMAGFQAACPGITGATPLKSWLRALLMGRLAGSTPSLNSDIQAGRQAGEALAAAIREHMSRRDH